MRQRVHDVGVVNRVGLIVVIGLHMFAALRIEAVAGAVKIVVGLWFGIVVFLVQIDCLFRPHRSLLLARSYLNALSNFQISVVSHRVVAATLLLLFRSHV